MIDRLPSEALVELGKFLSNEENKFLSQVCTKLQTIFQEISWKRCLVVCQIIGPHLFKRSYRILPLTVFFSPHKYSWFKKEYVQEVSLNVAMGVFEHLFFSQQLFGFDKLKIFNVTCEPSLSDNERHIYTPKIFNIILLLFGDHKRSAIRLNVLFPKKLKYREVHRMLELGDVYPNITSLELHVAPMRHKERPGVPTLPNLINLKINIPDTLYFNKFIDSIETNFPKLETICSIHEMLRSNQAEILMPATLCILKKIPSFVKKCTLALDVQILSEAAINHGDQAFLTSNMIYKIPQITGLICRYVDFEFGTYAPFILDNLTFLSCDSVIFRTPFGRNIEHLRWITHFELAYRLLSSTDSVGVSSLLHLKDTIQYFVINGLDYYSNKTVLTSFQLQHEESIPTYLETGTVGENIKEMDIIMGMLMTLCIQHKEGRHDSYNQENIDKVVSDCRLISNNDLKKSIASILGNILNNPIETLPNVISRCYRINLPFLKVIAIWEALFRVSYHYPVLKYFQVNSFNDFYPSPNLFNLFPKLNRNNNISVNSATISDNSATMSDNSTIMSDNSTTITTTTTTTTTINNLSERDPVNLRQVFIRGSARGLNDPRWKPRTDHFLRCLPRHITAAVDWVKNESHYVLEIQRTAKIINGVYSLKDISNQEIFSDDFTGWI